MESEWEAAVLGVKEALPEMPVREVFLTAATVDLARLSGRSEASSQNSVRMSRVGDEMPPR